MRITTRGRLAVSAMTDLALRQKLRPVALSTISARQGTSLSYLEQLFSALRRAGLVDSTRGPGGGYTLARRAEQISVADIILAVENLQADDLQNLGPGQAAQVEAMTGELWTSFNARVLDYLQSVSLQDLVAQQLEKGVTQAAAEAERPAAATRPRLSPRPRPLMARAGVPNSVFALGAAVALQRR
ncbi:MAG: Rrf2 family transcriptional regulator [Acidovorax sp.]|uniref:Rrf2 family transcriptional regulator n=1 Tax=Acidovorax sp. TaxID=1872122 RepID=UPI0039E6C0DD